MGDVVVHIGSGMGYLVGPVPDEVLQIIPDTTVPAVAAVWWKLATVAEQFADHGQALHHMPPEWGERPLGQAMRAREPGALKWYWFSQWYWAHFGPELALDVPPFHPLDLGPLLYAQVWSDTDWSTWVALVETYRAVHRQTQGNPWRA
jgi:hypothetical protein